MRPGTPNQYQAPGRGLGRQPTDLAHRGLPTLGTMITHHGIANVLVVSLRATAGAFACTGHRSVQQVASHIHVLGPPQNTRRAKNLIYSPQTKSLLRSATTPTRRTSLARAVPNVFFNQNRNCIQHCYTKRPTTCRCRVADTNLSSKEEFSVVPIPEVL